MLSVLPYMIFERRVCLKAFRRKSDIAENSLRSMAEECLSLSILNSKESGQSATPSLCSNQTKRWKSSVSLWALMRTQTKFQLSLANLNLVNASFILTDISKMAYTQLMAFTRPNPLIMKHER